MSEATSRCRKQNKEQHHYVVKITQKKDMANNGIFYEDDFEMPFVKLLEEERQTYTHGGKTPQKMDRPNHRNRPTRVSFGPQLSEEETDYAIAKLRNVSRQNEYEISRNAYYLTIILSWRSMLGTSTR